MIYPTRLAVLAAAAGAPVALVVAMQMADRWYVALAWPAAVLVATLLDAVLAISARDIEAILTLPKTASVGESVDAIVSVAATERGAPRRAEVAIASDALVAVEDDGRATVELDGGRGAVALPVDT
ncbi:MAG: DUF58 domain-containing protein, partial [Proteobacteria bacterium]|nr:DUF58 domain-containing protein [Pseudomonadota bacterium]